MNNKGTIISPPSGDGGLVGRLVGELATISPPSGDGGLGGRLVGELTTISPPSGDGGLWLVFVLLGSNQGDRAQWLRQARELLAQHAGRIVQQSALYESEPWGFASPDWFINQVVEMETALPPEQLLSVAQQIEKTLGREKPQGANYASRTMDIDILFFDRHVIRTPALIVPHPRLHERLFALLPLCEIAPEMEHPVLKKTIRTLLQECEDTCKVRKIQ